MLWAKSLAALPDFNTSELRPFLEAGEQEGSSLLAETPHFPTAPARDSVEGRNAEKSSSRTASGAGCTCLGTA
jgi:hypothetical protein